MRPIGKRMRGGGCDLLEMLIIDCGQPSEFDFDSAALGRWT